MEEGKMLTTANHAASQTIPGDGRAIATVSTEIMFATLRYRRIGVLIELATELSIPLRSGRYDAEPIDRVVCDDEDDAISYAVDLERSAIRRMNELDGGDLAEDGPDFQTALEKIFDRESQQYALAAE